VNRLDAIRQRAEAATEGPWGDLDPGQFIFHARQDIPTLLAVVEAVMADRWMYECRCDDAYTGRRLHEPNAICREGAVILAALAPFMDEAPTNEDIARAEAPYASGGP